ncbi:hypothetical protein DXG01_011656 [Tephrocybe rancida]|nr:hypothetical protein DXG01_011656 [Tephrocybe rancida]
MVNCPDCHYSFARLTLDQTPCSKCKARKPGMSNAELQALQKDIPLEIIKLPGIMDLLVGNKGTAGPGGLSSQILHTASGHQQRASSTRLAMGPPASTAPGLNKFKNLGAAQKLRAERGAKKAEAALVEQKRGIKITVMLWALALGHKKMDAVGQIHVSHVFEESVQLKAALEKLLEHVVAKFQVLYPDARQLSWNNIKLLSHESASKFNSLDYFDRTKTVLKLFLEFDKNRLTTAANLANRAIKVRFLYQQEDIRAASSVLQSSFLRGPPGGSSALRSSVLSSMPKPAPPGISPVVLKSAFRHPTPSSAATPALPEWSREPEMIEYSFTQTTAVFQDDCSVRFSTSRNLGSIFIAANWEAGEQGKVKKLKENGFIGKGFTKRGIYARFNNKEYVLTQPIDEAMSEGDTKDILTDEFKLLCQCAGFKKHFDNYARANGVIGIPEFYFNFPSAILGKLKPSLTSGSTIVLHKHFLATPLLPCGRFDSPIQKFTGNDDIGDASTPMTMAVHAFAHFSLCYSMENILFCDLQGASDEKGVMCLIDPQAHTSESLANARVYWDGGPEKIARFQQQHAEHCTKNWICNRLNLKNLSIEPTDEVSNEKSAKNAEQASKNKHSLDFIVQE